MALDEWIKVLLLGIIEGVTEFLPISSTGHLIVAAQWLELRPSLAGGVFEIFIQIGAVFAVLAYYWHELWHQATHFTRSQDIRLFWLKIVIASVPGAALGFLLSDWLQESLFRPQVVALALIAGGIVFIVVERWRGKVPGDDRLDQPISIRQSIGIGMFQVLALIPGMSRSGMSILGGLLLGVPRATATRFSFYLALPILGGATVYTLLKNLSAIQNDDLLLLFFGALVSAIVAWFSIAWLLRYVARNSFIPFGIYRIGLGVVILLLGLS